MPSPIDQVSAAFRSFASEIGPRAPLYRQVSDGIADDRELCAILLEAPPEQRRPVLLLAAVHDLVLDQRELPLAQHYASVVDRPLDSDPMQSFRHAVFEHRERITNAVSSRHTQTNEVGRCAPLLLALSSPPVDQPIGLVDIGCSAGLNLRLANFGYRFHSEDGSWEHLLAGTKAPTLTCSIRSPAALRPIAPLVSTRIGVDSHPIDIEDEVAVRWLEACVWPDQVDRLTRLREAIRIARNDPISLRTADAVAGLGDAINAVPPAELPVIINSWVLAYLSAEQRHRYQTIVDDIGRERDLTWVYLEAPSDCPELDGPNDSALARLTAVMRIDWRAGRRTSQHIGTMHPHGYWVHVAHRHT